jgi:hypothetical protein
LPLLFVLASLLDFSPALLESVLVLRQNGLLLRIFSTYRRAKCGLSHSRNQPLHSRL